jgi:predicted DsbA family dithiol-disulfide isomerase
MYAEQTADEERPAVRWLPYQLNPDLPDEGIPRAEYLRLKFGSSGHSYDHVIANGRDVGIDLALDRITVQPNTLNGHRLMLYGYKQGREDEVAEALFRAYFLEGANLTQYDTLAAIGERAGLDRAAVAAYLESDEDRQTVLHADIDARQAGINGVPFFIFNRRTAISGAHAPETLLEAMLQVRAREE